ncbi:MAG: methionyl-tRNA formyltransferase [Clostridium sp.]|nr:methionyl-tRNA formyltransferase [Clostridium sp.]
MNIVFMGTPDFAVPSLKAIIDRYGVKAVFTQPDKPKGRGKSVSMSPIKEEALKHNIPVFQPKSLRRDEELINQLKGMELDFIIVVAYGQILSKEVLDIPKYGCINLHGSLLPKYRGAAPIHYAIMKGEVESGNTTMLMDEGLDTGDMLLKNVVKIDENMTTAQLHDELMTSGAELLINTLEGLVDGKITPIKQGESETCYASMLNKEMAKIQWNKSSKEIHNFVRGLNSYPMAYTFYDGISMKVIETKLTSIKSKEKPGTIISVNSEGILVSTSDNNILITRIQFPNKRAMMVEEYIRGNEIKVNEILGQ